MSPETNRPKESRKRRRCWENEKEEQKHYSWKAIPNSSQYYHAYPSYSSIEKYISHLQKQREETESSFSDIFDHLNSTIANLCSLLKRKDEKMMLPSNKAAAATEQANNNNNGAQKGN
mmetsp:Transcript_4202/g.5430  ORF Transcript_4202/g.5430 Transcript_4202/m.5430 type:complete len:118 (-) Transcript_4202:166-519(-)